MRLPRCLILAALLPGAAYCGQIVYGSQLYPAFGAFVVQKTRPDDMGVAAQLNCWSEPGTKNDNASWCFALATEAVAFGDANPYLIGAENAVVNLNPANLNTKVANNAVFKCRMDGDPKPCEGPNNTKAWAYWVSAQPQTGFESAFKLDRNSIMASSHRRATVFDLEDLDPARDNDIVLFRLPGGREVTVAQFIQALDRP